MFVLSKNLIKKGLVLGIIAVVGATTSAAQDYNIVKVNDADVATIPVIVDLKDLQINDAPIYVSIQKRAEYMGIRGHGGVIKAVTSETMSTTFNVREAGEYAVSIWHDLDNDGVFSMNENYQVLDGWGGSGDVPTDRRPSFDDVKVQIETYGATVPVTMIYPS